jgi:hypothetical protein
MSIHFLQNIEEKKVNRKSGGIVIIFKKYLSTNMNIVQSESEYYKYTFRI